MFGSNKLYNESGFKNKEDAEQFINSLQGRKAKIISLKKSKQKENAPLLFNLANIPIKVKNIEKTEIYSKDGTITIIENGYLDIGLIDTIKEPINYKKYKEMKLI